MTETTAMHRQVVRIAEFALPEPKISGVTFEKCLILGPAVLALTGGEGSITGCTFDSDADSLLWVIPDDRPTVVGAIEIENCHFIECRFSMVGFAGPEDFAQKFRNGVGG